MIIASLGVFVGAVFSSGMMEVARKGIFMPSKFYFDEIMFIFMAVMIGDILLLDFFNTLGMPTSTTVSIVFNLLGAAVVMALIKIGMSDERLCRFKQLHQHRKKPRKSFHCILLSVVISFQYWYDCSMDFPISLHVPIRKESKELRICIRRNLSHRYRLFYCFSKGLKEHRSTKHQRIGLNKKCS